MVELPIMVVGAGGHGKVAVSTALAAGRSVRVIVDDDPRTWGTEVLGVPVVGDVSELVRSEYEVVLAVGRNDERKRLAAELDASWATLVHPHALVHPSSTLGEGSVVFAGAIVQPDCQIGPHVIVNTGSQVDHDADIGAYVHLGPNSCLAGKVRVGEGAFVGLSSSVLPGITIGAWSTVGAGGVVTSDVPPGAVVVGVPARPLELLKKDRRG